MKNEKFYPSRHGFSAGTQQLKIIVCSVSGKESVAFLHQLPELTGP